MSIKIHDPGVVSYRAVFDDGGVWLVVDTFTEELWAKLPEESRPRAVKVKGLGWQHLWRCPYGTEL